VLKQYQVFFVQLAMHYTPCAVLGFTLTEKKVKMLILLCGPVLTVE